MSAYLSDMDDVKSIKIPRGTIVKICDHPVKLKKSIYIEVKNGEFVLKDHEIMEAEQDEPQLEKSGSI